MRCLYTLGYQGISEEQLESEVFRLDAVIVDTRLKPWSQDPYFRKKTLEKKYGIRSVGGKYAWAGEYFGNLNYKNGGEIKLSNPDEGLMSLSKILESNNVILLCMCKSHTLCHRKEVVRLMIEKFSVPRVIHLYPNNSKKEVMDGGCGAKTLDMF